MSYIINPYRYAGASDGGNDSNCLLLLHCDGTDGATSTTDTSVGGSTHTITFNGNAQLDTAQKKFGTSSLLLDGSGDYLTAPDSDDFAIGSGSFTIDMQVRFDVTNRTQTLMARRDATNYEFQIIYQDTGFLGFYTSTNGTAHTSTESKVWTPTAGVWYHVAVIRTGTTMRAFINGTQLGADWTNSDTVANTTAVLGIGARSNGLAPLDGRLDEVRFSNIARWTANFTAPTVAYS